VFLGRVCPQAFGPGNLFAQLRIEKDAAATAFRLPQKLSKQLDSNENFLQILELLVAVRL